MLKTKILVFRKPRNMTFSQIPVQAQLSFLFHSVRKTEAASHCPYCVSNGERVMRVLENGRQICEECGQIIFPRRSSFLVPVPEVS